MGIDYNITIARGFLLKNIHTKNLDVPECIYEYFGAIVDGCFDGNHHNIFIPSSKIKYMYCGGYDEEWINYGIENFIGDEYDENETDFYVTELIKAYQKNKKPICMQLCRIPIANLPEEAYMLTILEGGKEKSIEKLLKTLDNDDNKDTLRNLLAIATYGDVCMKSYS